ncbi:MAG: two-component sensor histidine kinase [Pirellulaceae bacterium]|nr:two-component sensor histidine kinase [Pirellulaceae bacterium]
MTRLFLRLYFGVVVILIAAWLIQGYLFRTRSEADNIRVVERALGGGARLARQSYIQAPADRKDAALAEIAARFDYPVRIVPIDDRPMYEANRARLLRGDPILYYDFILIGLDDDSHLMELGPLPQFVGPSQTELTIGFGAIFALAAAAIAVLLRPVASQLRDVERTATAIAAGDLSARIEEKAWRRTLPLASAFNSMAERTETLLQSQRELLQAVSHELRTPLARIRFATDLIETSKTSEERTQRLEAVDKATQKLDDLVGELLTYVRLDSETSHAESEQVEFVSLLSDLIAIHAPLHGDVHFAIAAESENLRVDADRVSLSRAIGNLLSNAGRFATSRVTVAVSQKNNHIAITVDDDGEGIPESDWKRVFEPFVRLEDSKGRGSGLGLALVQRIALRQGGDVTVSKSPLGGARFEINLPISPLPT